MSKKKFKDIHKDEKTFIICNGPSLNDIDITKLNGHVLFILNRGYKLKERGLDISDAYLVAIDDIIQDQFKEEMRQVECKAKFANRIGKGDNIYHMKWTGNIPKFQTDITKPMWQGHSVTNVALQIAYYMGCDPVYIVGMDHYISYEEYEKGDRGYIVEGEDVNHFDPDYLPEGYIFHGQDLHMVEKGYELATNAFWADGRKLYNASTETALSEWIMPRAKFSKII